MLQGRGHIDGTSTVHAARDTGHIDAAEGRERGGGGSALRAQRRQERTLAYRMQGGCFAFLFRGSCALRDAHTIEVYATPPEKERKTTHLHAIR